MNHKRNLSLFAVAVFWLAIAGLLWTAASNSGNWHALSWATWLLYVGVGAPVIYICIICTRRIWVAVNKEKN